MKRIGFEFWSAGLAASVVLALVLLPAMGCKSKAAPNDMQVAGAIQTKLTSDPALANNGEINVAVNKGVATLSGNVDSAAARALAGDETGSVDGVKTVVNNLTVQPSNTVPAPNAAPMPAENPGPSQAPVQQKPSARPGRPVMAQNQPMAAPAPSQYSQYAPQGGQQQAPAPAQQYAAPAQQQARVVTLQAGTVIPVRISETLDTKTTQTGDVFHGSVANSLMSDGVVAIPQGTPVLGNVVDAKEAAHFKGNASLTLALTQMTARGQRLPLSTDTYNKEGAGRGKNTAIKAGGGAALGALIGALAGGGKGAAIGTLAGAGAGTGINAVTRGQQVVIPSETIIEFRLESPITVTVNPQGGAQNNAPYQPTLQRR